MSLHRTVERVPKELRSLFDTGRKWDQPFRRDETELVPVWLVHEDVGPHRVRHRASRRDMGKVHAHTAGRIWHMPRASPLRVLDTAEVRAVAFADGCERVLVLFQCDTYLFEFRWKGRELGFDNGSEQDAGDDGEEQNRPDQPY